VSQTCWAPQLIIEAIKSKNDENLANFIDAYDYVSEF
jgi:hypothetical protein